MSRVPVQLHAHPPERGRRRGVVVYGGCCCCCCCLHSAGGLLGATIASAAESAQPARKRESVYTRPIDVTRPTATLGPVPLYWLCLAGMMLVPCFYGSLIGGHIGAGIWAAVVYFPGVQLGASVLAVLVVLSSYRTGRREAFGVLAAITAMTVIGALIGGVLVVVLCGFSPLNLF